VSLRFDQPWFLLLGLLAVPMVLLGWRAMRNGDALRRFTALALRTLVLLLMAAMMAGPHLRREHRHLTVIGLLDISGSVRRFAELPDVIDPADAAGATTASGTQPALTKSTVEKLRQWFRVATDLREPDDRFGLVVFDGEAIALSAPTRGPYTDDNLDTSIAPGTNIAEAVRLGLAMFPADTAKRLVLVTDGNETAGSVMEAIKLAGGGKTTSPKVNTSKESGADGDGNVDLLTLGLSDFSTIPVDVLPIVYRVTGDVQVSRVEAPPIAQPGQTVTVRIALEAASPVAGTLMLRREGQEIDLNGASPGTSRAVNLPAGPSIHLAQVTLGQTPINRFEAFFQPDNPADDQLPDNDRAEAFTATPSKGSALVLNGRAGQNEHALASMLNAAEFPTEVLAPGALPDDLLSLQNYDLIVLDNIAASELSTAQQELLARWVNDLGGGLIMTGGRNGFGAGGWNGSPLDDLLPVNLDPPKEMRLPTAAVVFVMDKSGSMNFQVSGARATQQEIATEGAAKAIESLRRDAMVGVITFDFNAHVLIPLQENQDPRKLAEKVRSIPAEGGTNMEPALEQAIAMLRDAKVAKKRVVCMSDGRSMTTDNLENLARQMAAEDIQVTTIAVGDDADVDTMKRMAEVGGGEFYEVRDPRRLPRIWLETVQVMNTPLLKESQFTPRVLTTGSTMTVGLDAAPPLAGLVITSPREDPKVSMEMLHPDGEPLLAHWQAGLGRVAAFTSSIPDADGWARGWLDWPTAATFWTQLARTIARPAMNPDAELLCVIQDDHLQISFDLSALDDGGDRAPLDHLQVMGTVYAPDGSMQPVRLQQTAPGRYEASVEAIEAGNYIVAVNPKQGTRQLAPAIGGASRSTSPEFRRYQSNLALLDEIIETTGGRRLDPAQPGRANLFDRTNMPTSVSLLPAWRTLMLWTLGLLLLDVACRRIAWDYPMLRGWAAAMIAKVAPMSMRGREAATTLATLRRVSDQVDQRQEVDASGITKLRGTGKVAPPPLRIITSAPSNSSSTDQTQDSFNADGTDPALATSAAPPPLRPAPDQGKITSALEALLGRASSPASSAPQPPSVIQSPADDQRDTASETTSGLLAAKRRARRRIDGE